MASRNRPIYQLPEKTTPVSEDVLLLVDSEETDVRKKTKRITFANASSGLTSDHKVLVSGTDSTYSYLGSKIVEGNNVSITILNSGGNEQVEISATGSTNYGDDVFYIYNSIDNTKVLDFDLSNITTGTTITWTIPDITGEVTVQGNTFNGASQLVQLDSNGYLPEFDGRNLINLTLPRVIVSNGDGTGNYDGTTDIAIQAALNYVNSLGGGEVYIKRGTYTISNNLLVYDNTKLCGSGWDTILTQANGVNLDQMLSNADMVGTGNNRIIISDIRLNGNSVNNSSSGRGIKFGKCYNSIIEKVYCHDFTTTGIYISNSDYISCSNCKIYGNGVTINGIYLDDGDHCRIVMNSIYGCEGGSGINTRATNYTLITNNEIYLAGTNGIVISESAFYDVCSNNVIRECNIGMLIQQSYGISVTGNTCTGNTTYGIQIRNNSAGTIKGIVCSNNICSLNGREGIILQGLPNTVISNNQCFNNSQSSAGGYAGITLTDDTDYVTYSIVIGNRCFDTQASKTQKYGIWERNNSDYNIITNNIVNGNLTGSIVTIGGNSEVSHNIE